jgi:hypothetical protein
LTADQSQATPVTPDPQLSSLASLLLGSLTLGSLLLDALSLSPLSPLEPLDPLLSLACAALSVVIAGVVYIAVAVKPRRANIALRFISDFSLISILLYVYFLLQSQSLRLRRP